MSERLLREITITCAVTCDKNPWAVDSPNVVKHVSWLHIFRRHSELDDWTAANDVMQRIAKGERFKLLGLEQELRTVVCAWCKGSVIGTVSIAD